MLDLSITVLVTSIITATIGYFIHQRWVSELNKQTQFQISRTNEIERQAHHRELEYLAERNKAEIAHGDILKQVRQAAFEEGMLRHRAEYELQAKLFSVKISPYVQLITDTGIIYNEYEARAGYQYQLLINGIPAFQPHVVLERHEKVKAFDEKIKDTFLKLAEGYAVSALSTYLGANPQFAKIAPAVVDQVSKKDKRSNP